ncbi:MAG: hypothetical protein R2749_13160 [Acidimicrobiales bacterium]
MAAHHRSPAVARAAGRWRWTSPETLRHGGFCLALASAAIGAGGTIASAPGIEDAAAAGLIGGLLLGAISGWIADRR